LDPQGDYYRLKNSDEKPPLGPVNNYYYNNDKCPMGKAPFPTIIQDKAGEAGQAAAYPNLMKPAQLTSSGITFIAAGRHFTAMLTEAGEVKVLGYDPTWKWSKEVVTEAALADDGADNASDGKKDGEAGSSEEKDVKGEGEEALSSRPIEGWGVAELLPGSEGRVVRSIESASCGSRLHLLMSDCTAAMDREGWWEGCAAYLTDETITIIDGALSRSFSRFSGMHLNDQIISRPWESSTEAFP